MGILGYHSNTDIPKKSSKLHPLTKNDKKQNRQKAKERVGIEHTNRKFKIFRIFKETYRNHKKFDMRATLIAAFHNANLIYKATLNTFAGSLLNELIVLFPFMSLATTYPLMLVLNGKLLMMNVVSVKFFARVSS